MIRLHNGIIQKLVAGVTHGMPPQRGKLIGILFRQLPAVEPGATLRGDGGEADMLDQTSQSENGNPDQKKMAENTLEKHKALIHRYYEELWNSWNFGVIGEILTDDFVFHGSLGIEKTGHDGFIEYAKLVHDAFPDFHNAIEDLIAEGEKVAACLTYTGTHQGEIFGIPATGRAIRYVGVGIFVFRGDLISHLWVLGDRLALLNQLGDRDPGAA